MAGMAALIMNVFRQDAFSGLTLTEQVNRMPYIPTTLGDLGIFEDDPIMTTAVQVDRKDGVIGLIQTSPRGAPNAQRTTEKRQARYFDCTRLAMETTIYATELQNVRSETEQMMLKDLQEEVATRLTGPTGISNQIELTREYHRLGAIQGLLLDADGTPLHNWFNEFEISQPAEFVFNLAAGVAGTLIPLCNQIVRAMKRAAKGAWIEGVTEPHAVVGDTFFDAFTQHPDVIRTYQNWCAAVAAARAGEDMGGLPDGAPQLRRNRAFETFYFGGIYWHNYRGTDDNSTVAVPPNKAKFFPRRAAGVFKQALAPGEGFGDVNQRAKRIYIYRDIDPSEEKRWVKYIAKSFPLNICTRPEILQSGTADSTPD